MSSELLTKGIIHETGFLSQEEISGINREIDIYNRKTITQNSPFASMSLRTRGRTRLIPFSEAIVQSVNIPKLAIQICKRIEDLTDQKDLKITAIYTYLEQSNPEGLFWHTDNRKGMYRAILYLKGGNSPTSGCLKYMIGTHERDYYIAHKLTDSQVDENKSKIFVADGGPGAISIFDPNGFHGRTATVDERRIILFEFQNIESEYVKSNIFLSSVHIDDYLIENIDKFQNGVPVQNTAHGLDVFRTKEVVPWISDIWKVNLDWIKFYLRKFIKPISKILGVKRLSGSRMIKREVEATHRQ